MMHSNNSNLPEVLVSQSQAVTYGLATVTGLVEQATSLGWTVSSIANSPAVISFCRDLPGLDEFNMPNIEWADVTNEMVSL